MGSCLYEFYCLGCWQGLVSLAYRSWTQHCVSNLWLASSHPHLFTLVHTGFQKTSSCGHGKIIPIFLWWCGVFYSSLWPPKSQNGRKKREWSMLKVWKVLFLSSKALTVNVNISFSSHSFYKILLLTPAPLTMCVTLKLCSRSLKQRSTYNVVADAENHWLKVVIFLLKQIWCWPF